MPSFKKKVLSAFIRNGCQRQFRLNLYSDPERKAFGLPPRQTIRAGAGLVGKVGYAWQEVKVAELSDVFGGASVIEPKHGAREVPLHEVIATMQPHRFIVEAAYEANTALFREAMGFDSLRDEFGYSLDIGEARPDLVQVLPPLALVGSGEKEPYRQEVLPDGELLLLAENDPRLRLQVIDIKLSAEPGAHYFAEVVYYALTLSAWVRENGFANQFVVIAASAVWPGSYEASAVGTARQKLVQRGEAVTLEALAAALEEDLELASFDAFVPRLRRIFRETLPDVLTKPWRELAWHVDYSCAGCEFLGYPWQKSDGTLDYNELWCWNEAKEGGHLSQVAGLSRGNARQLGIPKLADLAALPPASVLFDKSPTLRTQRSRFPGRATALCEGVSGILPDSGSDASMPRWPDLHVYLFVDYDLASAVTVSFALRAFWSEPLPFGSPLLEKQRQNWNEKTGFQEVFVVESYRLQNLERERSELLKFLHTLRCILDEVRSFDKRDIDEGRRTLLPTDSPKRSTYQIFLWDEAQRRHLQRVVGRHLSAILNDPRLRDLAWLFPPPELLTNPEEASIRSPFTLVSRVVQNTVAVPLPHHYTLFGVAQHYHSEEFTPPSIHPLYRDPLSDLIPGERIHELWTKRGDWTKTLGFIKQTAQYKLLALGTLVTQLERDLKAVLNDPRLTAPVLGEVPSRLTGLPPMSLLLHEFTRLNAALQDLDTYTTRAMPPHEREARFRSAHLTHRLEGEARTEALQFLRTAAGKDLPVGPGLVVYQLAPTSCDFNARPGDIGFALAPRDAPGFLQQSPFSLTKDSPYKPAGLGAAAKTMADSGLTAVSIEAIDRVRGLIALRLDDMTHLVRTDDAAKTPYSLEEAGFVDLSENVMLDPVEQDFLTKKVRLTLRGIGYPQIAHDHEAMNRALGLAPNAQPATFDPPTPAARFLWDGAAFATESPARDLPATRSALEAKNFSLNSSQWAAWEGALSRRVSLIWGPPGTGKSETLRTLVAGALLDAHRRGVPLRLLVAANNYTALDEVLLRLPEVLAKKIPELTVTMYRLQSELRAAPVKLPEGISLVIPKTKSAPVDVLALQNCLANPTGLLVVGAVPHQLHNLALSSKNRTGMNDKHKPAATQSRWFDLIVMDEASQMDVASATLVVSKAAEDGAFVLAGDDLQLPPIHQADPPKDLERYVGSVFEYVRHVQGVKPISLKVNYRSNKTLVDFTCTAGYDRDLHAYSPDLRLSLTGLPTEQPSDWPDTLVWSPGWARFLNPAHPATAFVYDDDTSGQANDFEADAVAALVWLLRGRLHDQLLGQLRSDGSEVPPSGRAYEADKFWEKAVGVVTPHKAQMSKIVGRLQGIFPNDDPEKIRTAVDTVERFQGQQRDVILASFGLGDPDLIRAEDEFLYSLRRFNVLASRARAKLIVLSPQSLIDHLSNDVAVLEESRLLKRFVESYCQATALLTLPYFNGNEMQEKRGFLRQR